MSTVAKTNKVVRMFVTNDPDGNGYYALFPLVLKDWGFDVLGVEKKLGMFLLQSTVFSPMGEESEAGLVKPVRRLVLKWFL